MIPFPQTRLHRLEVADQKGCRIWLKREDEAGGTIAAGKFRKFASLLPWLKLQEVQQVVVIGSAQSNQVLAAAQLLPQAGIKPIFFLKQGNHNGPGNAFLTRLLSSEAIIRQFEAREWHGVEAVARTFAEESESKTYVLPEGAFCPPALPGTFSLATDLLQNLEEHPGIQPRHLFVDAGTGLSAIGLLMGLARADLASPPMVHIVGMAMDQPAFEARLATAFGWPEAYPEVIPYHYSQPQNAKSFGAVNATVLNAIQRYARDWSVLTDPIYSAKLFWEAERIIKEDELEGDIVLIHSGGVNSLMGFFSWFQKTTP